MGEYGGVENAIFLCAANYCALRTQNLSTKESSLVLRVHGLRHVCGIRTVHGLSIRLTLYKYYF